MPKARKISSNRSTPYGRMSSDETADDRLAEFLTSDRSRRRSAVVDANDSFSAAVSLPLNLKCLTTDDLPQPTSDTEQRTESDSQSGTGSDAKEVTASLGTVKESKDGGVNSVTKHVESQSTSVDAGVNGTKTDPSSEPDKAK